ncbi:MAG: conjugal transfer protein TraG N-terminal domain-containing protein [bacterium]
MLTVYAFGNGYLLYGMFQAIALFFNFNNVGVLFTILAMIAVIYYGIRVTMFHQGSLLSTSKYFLAFFIILSVLVYNKTTVIVNDVSNPSAPTNAQPINNVPWGVAQLWSGFTNIQYALAKDFTTAFSTPTGDNLLNMGVGVSIVQQEDSAMISTSNSYLFQDYNEYISNCVVPGISAGYLNVSDLLAAGNATNTASQTYGANEANSIWAVMSTYTSGAGANMLTEWYSGTNSSSDTFQASGAAYPQGTTTTCLQETTWLNSAIQNYYIPNNLGPSMAGELQFASFSELANSLGQINPYIFNMQQTGQAQLMQAIGVNMYAPAILKMAQTSGASASSLAVATGTGTVSTQEGMLESGIMAGRYMPIVFGIFEALALGASVLILILTITHMGVKYLKLLFEILIMITIWPSLTAVFNYVSQLIIQAQYQPLSGLGYSVSGSGEISSFLASSLAWMGYFSWSVPMMAYAIASGSSYAMTSMVGGMDSAISKNAGVKGADAGLGNMTAGQVRNDNYSANKFDATHTQNTGSKGRNFSDEYNMRKQENYSGSGMTVQMLNNDTAVISEGGNTITAVKGTNGHWSFDGSYNGPFKAQAEEMLKTTSEKSYSQELSNIASKTGSLTNSTADLLTARNEYRAGNKIAANNSVARSQKTFNGIKNTHNTSDAHSTSNGTDKTASAGFTVLGSGIKGSTIHNKSHSVNTARGTSHSSGTATNISADIQHLKSLSKSHDAAIANQAKKELKTAETLKSELKSANKYDKKMSETANGGVTAGMSSISAYLNMTRTGFSLGSLTTEFKEFNANAENFKSGAKVSSQINKTGQPSFTSPKVKKSISLGENKLKHLIQNNHLNPSSVNHKINNASAKINNDYNNNAAVLNYLSENAGGAYSSVFGGVGHMATGYTGQTIKEQHGFKVATNIYKGIQYDANFGAGVATGTVIGFAGGIYQPAGDYLYKGKGIYDNNAPGFMQGLNLAAHGPSTSLLFGGTTGMTSAASNTTSATKIPTPNDKGVPMP